MAHDNAAIRRSNARVEAGNRARTKALTNIVVYAERGDERRAREWVVRLVAAGFNAKDGAAWEREALPALAAAARRLLGMEPVATSPAAPGGGVSGDASERKEGSDA